MKTARFETLVTMIIAASSIGARGISCGPCPPRPPRVVSWTPPPDLEGGLADAYIASHCGAICGQPAESCARVPRERDAGDSVEVECAFPPGSGQCVGGRRPEALAEAAFSDEVTTTAGWLGRVAHLEAAAILAFRDLRRDLRALGAPRRLLRAASRARRDEVRHARVMGALARRHGANVPPPRAEAGALPTLEQLATRNAVEGCVRESYGAVVARWQAMNASDREVRSAMARIAHEEAAHAALSFAIDAWARPRLTREARARVDGARAEAARALVAVAERGAVPRSAALGLPDPPVAARLARGLLEVMHLAA